VRPTLTLIIRDCTIIIEGEGGGGSKKHRWLHAMIILMVIMMIMNNDDYNELNEYNVMRGRPVEK